MASHSGAATERPRRRWLRWALLGLAVLVIGLGALGVPLVKAVGQAQAARDSLAAAQDNIDAGNVRQARADLASARTEALAAQSKLNGIAGQVWSWVPIAGTAVLDSRHLVDASLDTTTVASTGLDLKEQLAAADGKIVANGSVDLQALQPLLDRAADIGGPLAAANKSLGEVRGTTPFVGSYLADKRDQALSKLAPLTQTYVEGMPALQALPQILGADGKHRYLIAILNPGELRYSGGATLSLAEMTTNNGRLRFDKPADIAALNQRRNMLNWQPVDDNPLHTAGPMRLTNATFNPNWGLSGEELLRAWKASSGTDADGVIAIDLPALSRLFRITGPVQVAPYGELNADNLVSQLASSYDDYTPAAQAKRKKLNDAIIPAFRTRFLEGGRYQEKMEALRDAGDARQFALYFRDPALQSAMAGIGLDGNLSATKGDFIFVATQNVNGSKVDFFQKRAVSASVTIGEDRSVRNRVVMTLRNDTPPYAGQGEDRRFGYYTRWAGISGAVFMPDNADIESARINGSVVRRKELTTRDRLFFYKQMMIRPGGKRNLAYSYRLKNAVDVEDGRWVYHLTLQPQSIASTQVWVVSVTWPAGHTFDALRSPGWKATGANSAEFAMSGVPTSQDLQLTLTPN